MAFSGQEKCLVDKNGRVKLPRRFVRAFQQADNRIVVHCLSEGALAVYPFPVWIEMRQAEAKPGAKAAESVVFRRRLRRFGAFTQEEHITNQGRITIPVAFRESTELQPEREAYLVGTEIGVEIWEVKRWERELRLLQQHEQEKASAEMEADVTQNKENNE